jgi:uncharacterized protein DUF397
MTPNRDRFVGWHKSRHSDQGDNGGCVGVGYAPGLRGIEDTTLGEDSPIAVIGEEAFQKFLAAAKATQLA